MPQETDRPTDWQLTFLKIEAGIEQIAKKGKMYEAIIRLRELMEKGKFKEAITFGEKIREEQRKEKLVSAVFLHLAGNAGYHAATDEEAKPRKATPIEKVNFLEQAVNNFTKAAQLFDEIHDPESTAASICNRAICLQELGRETEALEDFRHSLDLTVSANQRETLLRLGALHSLSIQETQE